MSADPLVFHHVGLLTDQPELAARRLQRLGYTASAAVFDPLQGATLQLCHGPAGASTIELVTPARTNSSLSGLLRRRGDYMYHVCFEVPTIDEGLAWLRLDADDRLVEVAAPRPAILFDHRRVAFYSTPGLGLVEFLERAVDAPAR